MICLFLFLLLFPGDWSLDEEHPEEACLPLKFNKPGDYLIGGLLTLCQSPSHVTLNMTHCKCEKMYAAGCQILQLLDLTLAEINNSTQLLPNISLGYQVLDCSLDTDCLDSTLLFLSNKKTMYVDSQPLMYKKQTDIKAIFGPSYSATALGIGGIVGAFQVPLISASATNQKLSNKELYPSFMRTTPNDKNLVLAILQFLKGIGWKWVSLLVSADDYGSDVGKSFTELAPEYGVCVAYKGVLAIGSNEEIEASAQESVKKMIFFKTKIAVILSVSKSIVGFYTVALREPALRDKVWLSSDTLSKIPMILEIPGYKRLGTLIVFGNIQVQVPEDFMARLQKHTEPPVLPLTKDGLPTLPQCDDCRVNFSAQQISQEVLRLQSAVYTIAHGIHKLLSCDSKNCIKRDFLPKELLVEMRKVQFSLFNQSVYYDENGDPPFGYDILLLRNQGSEFVFKSIGVYSQKTRQESIDENWVLFLRNKTGKSSCSDDCQPGHRKQQTGLHRCCWECNVCPEGTFFNTSDEYNCHLCPKAHWSPQGSERCFPRTLRYLSWDSGIGVGLLVSTSAVLLVVVATGAVFALKRHTPVVRSSGGKMAFIMLASLLSSCICLYGNFGMPSTLSCHFRTLSELCFTVCLACIAVRSCQLLCIFKLAAKLPKACDFWIKDRGQYVLIFLCTVPQVVISIYLITGDVPVPEYFEKDMVLLTCKTYNPFLNLSYNAALILLCFVFSYAGKNLPDNYNEAKCIAFSLFICIVSRVSYMTVITVYKGDTVDFHIACSLVNVSAAYGSYFLPKCYAILLRPELNTTAHFQSCIQLYTMQKSTH